MTPQDRAERIIHDLDYKPPEQWRGRVYELVIAAIMDAVGEERERCAKIAEWFHNVENFTAADVAKRIRNHS